MKAVHKNFNDAGEALVTRLQAFRSHGVHVLGSFIFGLPTDTRNFEATADLAQRAGVSVAQFVMLHAVSGTVDFAKWEQEASAGSHGQRHPADALLADPAIAAAEGLHAASADVAPTRSGAARSSLGPVLPLSADLAAFHVRAIAPRTPGVRPDLEALPADVRQHGHCHRQRARRALGTPRAMAGEGGAPPVHRRADARSGGACRTVHHARYQAAPRARHIYLGGWFRFERELS